MDEKTWTQSAALALRLLLTDYNVILSEESRVTIEAIVEEIPDSVYDDFNEDLRPTLDAVVMIETMRALSENLSE